MRSKVKPLIIVFISYLLVFLFVYAATSKMLEFQNFQAQLGQSPLVSAYTGFVSYAVLAIELGISVVLVIPKKTFFRTLSFVLFNGYVYYIHNSHSKLFLIHTMFLRWNTGRPKLERTFNI